VHAVPLALHSSYMYVSLGAYTMVFCLGRYKSRISRTRISTVRYNWPMSAHASQTFRIAHCTDSEDLPRTTLTI